MSHQDLLDQLQRRPFESFRIHVSDGTVVDVHHPEMVLPGFTAAVIGIPTDPNFPTVYGKLQTVSLNHIVRLEPISKQATPSNGQE